MTLLRGAPSLVVGVLWLGFAASACDSAEVPAQAEQPLHEVMAEALREGHLRPLVEWRDVKESSGRGHG